MIALLVELPIRTTNPLNLSGVRSRRAQIGFAAKHRREKQQAAIILGAAVANRKASGLPLAPPFLVTLTRVAFGRGLDPHDGLPASLKWIVDGVAQALGLDDRDARIAWRYRQRRGAKGKAGVEVLIEGRAT